MADRVRIAIIGSRDFPRPDLVEAFVAALPDGTVVISGGAQGVDNVAMTAARLHGLRVGILHEEWKDLDWKGSQIRRAEIVANADRLVAFWNRQSRGTVNTIVEAHRVGLPIEIYGNAGESISLSVALEAAKRDA